MLYIVIFVTVVCLRKLTNKYVSKQRLKIIPANIKYQEKFLDFEMHTQRVSAFFLGILKMSLLKISKISTNIRALFEICNFKIVRTVRFVIRVIRYV